MAMKSKQTAGRLLVRSLVEQGVKYIFGIPGGKIMPTFDVLRDEGPQLIVCRHEQNAAFMAAAVGRLTGRPGVCLVTSGPGTGNIVTGAATATTEGDAMVAIGGVVPLADTLKQTHQSMDSVAIMKPITKFSVAVNSPEAAGEAVANAFRAAMAPRPGASFIAFPRDVQGAATDARVPPLSPLPELGAAPADMIQRAAAKLSKAKSPVVLLGMGASEPRATAAVRALLKHHGLPVIGTFQGAGAVSRELLPLFFGRVGLFRNQPGDKALARADVVLTIGYDPVEYDPSFWNVGKARTIIHLDSYPCDIDNHYEPELELRGAVPETVSALASMLPEQSFDRSPELQAIHAESNALLNPPPPKSSGLVHPLSIVLALRSFVDDDTIIASDMGSHHIWMARHFFEFEPRKLLFSNGQQTLGVGIPWAMAANLIYPSKKTVATVGDGGFLFSSMELETAVRLKQNITVVVFRDGGYNMVAFQQELIYGRTSGTNFGNPDLVKYAESFGAVGLRVNKPDELVPTLRKGLETPGVVVIDIPTDYSKNVEIGQHVIPEAWD
ncbi:MAG: acetolactate synthase AlsS [Acidobacteriaceae bacterium]|nr:acetolactate synthase AlsS [Acidobacteriaceae bacterium]